ELVEFDRRVAELMERLTTLTTDAEVTEWHRMASALMRDLEAKGGVADGVDDLVAAMQEAGWRGGAGGWHWGANDRHVWGAPGSYNTALEVITKQLQDQIQDLILKDLVSARDEATPPEFRELVERYYEVLSKDGGTK